MKKIGVIVPTWNNNQYLIPCLESMLSPVGAKDLLHVYVVNNGEKGTMDFSGNPNVTLLEQEENLGWEGGLIKGLEHAKEELIIFMNDDAYIPHSSSNWAERMASHFESPEVGAVGPTSNVVRGVQNIFLRPFETDVMVVNYLIGFCIMVRRSALEAVGGVDDTLPGGDDLDLSIRLRQGGYKLLCDRTVFVYHHGFKTGERVKGGPSVAGGWNSMDMVEKTNFALIEKFGIRPWLDCMRQV